jgi:hypothetical protein
MTASWPPAVVRALEGLAEGRGRTIVIAGPPFSGKSELLASIRRVANERGYARVDLTGSYRNRTKPFEALASLEVTRAGPSGAGGDKARADVGGYMYVPGPLFAPVVGGDAARLGPARGGLPGGLGGGGGGAVGGRVLNVGDLHASLLRSFREDPAVPILVSVEDATLLDPESRDSIVLLRPKARYRPILVVLALDVSQVAFQAWEERLTGRAEVDWVRFRHAKPDPREAARLQEKFELLPEPAQRILLLLTLLGGSVPELTLARVARSSLGELANQMGPAVASNLIRLHEGKTMIPHDAWIDIIPQIVPEPQLRRAHLEVADALTAMTSEPDLRRRMELTHHYYEAAHDALALPYLVETSEICDQLQAFDASEDLLARALRCVPSLPEPDRPAATAELGLLHARALILAGRIREAEVGLHDAFRSALASGADPERLEEWASMVLPVVRMLGPRASLVAIVEDLTERFAAAGAPGAEVVFRIYRIELDYERGRYDEALRAANAVARRARGLEPLIAQSASRFAATLFVSRGGYSVQAEEELFLAPQADSGRARRSPLAQLVDEVQLRWVERDRDAAEALAAHTRAIAVAQHLRTVAMEVYHQVDLAEIDLDGRPTPRGREAANRALEIVELVHLMPPAPIWVRCWLLQGRLAALEDRLDEARDIWGAVADRPYPLAIGRYRAEAAIRLALLELADGKEDAAQRRLGCLEGVLAGSGVPEEWATAVDLLARAAPDSRHGAARLPTRPAAAGPTAPVRGPGPAPTAP